MSVVKVIQGSVTTVVSIPEPTPAVVVVSQLALTPPQFTDEQVQILLQLISAYTTTT
jgi:hypothetical protein